MPNSCGQTEHRTRWPAILSVLLLSAATWAVVQPAHSAAAEPARVEVLLFESDEGLAIHRKCAQEFEALRPGIKIDISGDPRIADKLRIRILEQAFPEVTSVGVNYWNLIRHDMILPLDEFLDGPDWDGTGTWRDSFLPGSLDRYAYDVDGDGDKETYGVPAFYNVNLMWYNKKMFAEQGWAVPRTWPQLLELCETIQAAKVKVDGTTVAPMAFQGRYHGYAQSFTDSIYYRMAGRDRFYAQQELIPGSYDNPEYIQALRWTQDLARYFQPGAMGMDHKQAQREFFQGKTAMVKVQTSIKYEMRDTYPDDFQLGAFNFPSVENPKGDPTAVNPGIGYFLVFKQSEHPREAVEFVRYLTCPKVAGYLTETFDIPTAVKGTQHRLSEPLGDAARIIAAAGASYGLAPGEGFPGMEQYRDDARYKLLTQKISPEQAAAILEDGATAIRKAADHPDRVTVRHVWKPTLLLALIFAGVTYWTITTITRIRKARRSASRAMTAGRIKLNWTSVLIFVGPAFLLYTVFSTIPSLRSLVWCFFRWDGLTNMDYVGLMHFKRMLFENNTFWIALKNNLFIMFVIPMFVLPWSLFMAACISRRMIGATMFRIVFFFPNILGGVAATLLWMHMYNPMGGPINTALAWVGGLVSDLGLTSLGGWLEGFVGFAWLSQDYLYWALIPMSIWGACGFNMILFLAAMESIPDSLYDAAEIDGASAWQQFWKITLPLIHEVLTIAIVFMVIGGMRTFETIWLLTNQRPTTDTHVIGTLMVYSMFTEFKVGQATAIAVLLFVLVFFGTAVTLRLLRRESVEF